MVDERQLEDDHIVVGDGGFAHVWLELETAKRHGVKVAVVVMINMMLGYKVHGEAAGLGRYGNLCEFQPVNHAAIATACGVKGITRTNPADSADTIQQAMAVEASVVIGAMVDPNALQPVKALQGLKYYWSFGKRS